MQRPAVGFSPRRTFGKWLFAFSLVAALASASMAGSFGVGARAPDFVMRDLVSRRDVGLAALRGRVVLIYAWREVCPLCLDEAKEMDRVARAYGPRGVRSLIIIERGDALEIEMESEIYRPASAMINDPEGEFGRLYGIKKFPQFLVVDGRGILRYRGPLLRTVALAGLIEKLLGEGSPGPAGPGPGNAKEKGGT